MKKTAINKTRPWEQPFWKPAPGKRVILAYLLLIHVLAVKAQTRGVTLWRSTLVRSGMFTS